MNDSVNLSIYNHSAGDTAAALLHLGYRSGDPTLSRPMGLLTIRITASPDGGLDFG